MNLIVGKTVMQNDTKSFQYGTSNIAAPGQFGWQFSRSSCKWEPEQLVQDNTEQDMLTTLKWNCKYF
jgi:hypothetical protein